MTNDARTKFYYKDSGERLGPLPADGGWPQYYGKKGFHLEPPDVRLVQLCAIETCEHSQVGHGFPTLAELVRHALAEHGLMLTTVWRDEDGETVAEVELLSEEERDELLAERAARLAEAAG